MKTYTAVFVAALTLFLVSAGISGQNAPKYDMLLKGGRVIDPANGIDRICDVAVSDGLVARVADDIPAMEAAKTVDVTGYIVTPGFLDIHSHCFATFGEPGRWVFPDHHSFQSGVTTFIDAGTAGADSFEDFKKVIDISRTRILAFLNIAAPGKNDAQNDPRTFDVARAVETAQKYPNIIVGFKSGDYMRHDIPYDDLRTPWANIDSSIAAGKKAGLPVMANFYPRPAEGKYPVRSLRELLNVKFRKGDILTCMFSPHIPVVTAEGKLNQDIVNAQKRGILFDATHGTGSMVFRNAAPAIAQGFIPDTISTDLHGPGREAAVVDLLNVMNKFLNLGVPLEEIIQCTTVNPARAVNRPELGTISPGSPADLAVIEQVSGEYTFVDTGGGKIRGDSKLRIVMTVFGGSIVFDPYGASSPYWEDIPENARYWETPSGQMW